MRKRVRPLDAHEECDVEKDQLLELEILRDEVEYVLKWPKAPLTLILRADPSSSSSRRVHVAQMDAVLPPREAASTILPLRGAGRSDTFFSLTTGQASTLVEALGAKWTPDAEAFAVHVVGVAEKRAYDELKRSYSLQRLVALRSAVRFEEVLELSSLPPVASTRPSASTDRQKEISPSSWQISLPPEDVLVVARATYELWATERARWATQDKPWGIPLMPKYFIPAENEEYFIPVGNDDDGAANEDGLDRRDGGLRLRRSTKRGPFSHVAFDCKKLVKVPGEKDLETFMRALPPLMDLEVNHVLMRVNDLGPEIRDCLRWLHSLS